MKHSFLDRVLIFIFALLASALAVLTALRAFDIDPVKCLFDGMEANFPGLLWKLAICGIALIIVLLAVFTIREITPAKKQRVRYISLVNTDKGDVKLAVDAINGIVQQSLTNFSGIENTKIGVSGNPDSVDINLTTDFDEGTHLPSLTANMQDTIKRYIESNCGVAVRNVSITVGSMIPSADGYQTTIQSYAAPHLEPETDSFAANADEPITLIDPASEPVAQQTDFGSEIEPEETEETSGEEA